MNILKASELYLDAWLYLRKQLWPDSDEVHLQEIGEILASQTAIAFLMFDSDKEPIGFIEGALYLNSAQSYGYVEGWFVAPTFHRQGFGGELLGALEEWLLHHAIGLSLSDTIPEEYPLSSAAHAKHGYREWRTLQIFMKQLNESLDPPPIEDDLPLSLQAEFKGMEMLSDDALWSIAESHMNEDKVLVYDDLLERCQMDNLTAESQILLDSLREEADFLMLRKAQAYLLLKNRGYKIASVTCPAQSEPHYPAASA